MKYKVGDKVVPIDKTVGCKKGISVKQLEEILQIYDNL